MQVNYILIIKMSYSLETHYKRYVQGQDMSFAKNIGNNYGKKLFDKSIDVKY